MNLGGRERERSIEDESHHRYDLTRLITVGEIVRRPEYETSELRRFTVSYHVQDADGNEATAHRDIVVSSLSHSMRNQLLSGDVVVVLSGDSVFRIQVAFAGAVVAIAYLSSRCKLVW